MSETTPLDKRRSSEWNWEPATVTSGKSQSMSHGIMGSMTMNSPGSNQTPSSNEVGMTSPKHSFQVPTSVGGPEYFAGQHQDGAKRYVVLMVGLPARGKTFMAQKLCRLLGWQGYRAECYNIQAWWKEAMQSVARTQVDAYEQLHDKSSNARKVYSQVLQQASDRAQEFFTHTGGQVLFINDDFVTEDLRNEAVQAFNVLGSNHSTFFIEVLRDAAANAKFDAMKVRDPSEYDPKAIAEEAAMSDFKQRVELMKSRYETLTESSNYIKVLNSAKLEVHGVSGYLPSRIVSYLLNLSQFKVAHPIYFSRHGQSMYNLEDRLGGNPELTEKGLKDADYLRDFIHTLKNDEAADVPENEIQIWTSQLTRAIQTAEPAASAFGIKKLKWSSLNEIHAGVCENMTYGEVKDTYPLIHRFRSENKYTFRYPEGESYQDLVARVEPVIMELENANRVVVVIAHQAVLRVLLAYFGTHSADESVYVEVPHRTVWRCQYSSNGITTVDKLSLGPQKGEVSKM